MIQRKLNDKLTELIAENGIIHQKGTDTYFTKGMVINPDEYEEVAEIPKYTYKEYKEKVRELIRERYDVEDEIAILANLNSPMPLSEDKVEEHSGEYLDYQSYREACKVKAKEILNNKTDGEES